MPSFNLTWSELVVAGTCVDLLTDQGIFTGGNEVKKGRIERQVFLSVKIVNGGTCAGKVNFLALDRRRNAPPRFRVGIALQLIVIISFAA